MATMSAKKVAEWQKTYPRFKIPEDILATCGPWPSLEVNDFLVYAKGREYPPEVVRLVEELRDEIVWAYGMWAQSVVTDPGFLLTDMMVNCVGSDQYNFTRKFIQDYAKSHGYAVEQKPDEALPPWRQATESAVAPPMSKAKKDA